MSTPNMAAPMTVRASRCLADVFRRRCSLQKLSGAFIRCLTTTKNGDDDGKRETHFGFEYIPEEEKEGKVYEVFENVASRYDLMNDTMSAGVHRLWKDHFMECMAPTPGTTLIDVAGGTGDIALRFLRYIQSQRSTEYAARQDFKVQIPREIKANIYMDPADEDSSDSSSSDEETESSQPSSVVTVCDINQAMLDVGKTKLEKLGFTSGISWLQGNAESLPLEDNTYDVYTIAFGIRNCTHIDKVLSEAYRVLKPGGRFMCLEFSQVNNALLRSLYDSYSFQVIPVMGQLIAGDWKSYQYLVESIRQFPNQEDFSAMIRRAGFRVVSHENLTFGVAAIHSGFKIV
ncbi:2-methoxy-6-polyprenyl-1,4-benzoquinol methylase, mitochondrial-like [Haliotis rufescens]|uniref:2-methoxy-6-polyprenyl-1,4-benzoquinol methylase, mitochondrial-like n=1 Tax=Haliotis rufescens TaxID=6454 RepID=UPI001EB09119|nr:2-methoxy-6-polyprenyl-1,4-benzoquinol methylase, mitochondrial-like [Haliotis rufescens]